MVYWPKPKRTIIGTPTIQKVFRWRTDDGPSLYAVWAVRRRQISGYNQVPHPTETPIFTIKFYPEKRKFDQRGTFICAHALIFFKLCRLITYYIRTMKMYLSNKIVKNKAQEASLTYSTFEVVPVSKFPCPESIGLFISMICHLD